jgi:hypothetical protein
MPEAVDEGLLVPDNKIAIWRQADGYPSQLERVYLLRKREREIMATGIETATLYGLDGIAILEDRIYAYEQGVSGYTFAGAADNIMKAVMNQCYVLSALGAGRTIPTAYLTIEADLSIGTSITKSMPNRTVLSILQDIAADSREQVTNIYWDMQPTSEANWTFITRTGQIGSDHTTTTGSVPVMLSTKWGTLENCLVTYDYTDEKSYIYAAGQGVGGVRITEQAEDTTRSLRNVWGRKEGWRDARNSDTSAGIQAEATAELAQRRPRVTFAADIVQTPYCQYGVHYRWGDRVSCEIENLMFDAMLQAVQVRIGSDGNEKISARLEGSIWL